MPSHSLDQLCSALQIPETEDTWEKISKAVQQLTKFLQDSDPDHAEALIPSCRMIARALTSAANSERTRLSGSALDAITAMAAVLCQSFDTLLPLYFPTILTLCGRANKVTLNRSRECLLSIIESTQLPAILTYLIPHTKDKSTSLRLISAEAILACLHKFNPPDLEKSNRPMDIEGVIRATARDANADVRKAGKKIFDAYTIVLPGRVDNFVAPLSPTIKKYLDIKGQPRQTAQPTLPHAARSVSQPKLNSLAFSASNSRPTFTSNTSKPAHARSASSSAIAMTRPVTNECAKQNTTSKPHMPPPDFIPVHPTRPPSSQSSRPPSQETQRIDRLEKQSDHRRAISSQDAGTSSRPPHVGSSVTANMRTVMQDPGPKRLHPGRAAEEKTLQSSGPRKVTLILSGSLPFNPSKSTPATFTTTAPPRRVEIVKPSSVVTTSEGPKRPIASKPVAVLPATVTSSSKTDVAPAANAKKPTVPATKAVEKAKALPSSSSTKPPASKPTAKPSAILKAEQPKPKPAQSNRAGATQPTQSQLARAKSTLNGLKASANSKVTSSKPMWGGRPAAASSKSKASASAPVVRPNAKAQPTQIPLPPSPTPDNGRRNSPALDASKQATLVPLPPSPEAKLTELPAIEKVQEIELVQKGSIIEVEDKERVDVPQEEVILELESIDNEVATDAHEREVVSEEGEQPVTIAMEDSNGNGGEKDISTRETAIVSQDDVHGQDKANDAVQEIQEVTMAQSPPKVFFRPTTHTLPPQTPISSLLSSIEHGFLNSPPSPLSPPIKYHPSLPKAKPLAVACPFLKPTSLDSRKAEGERQALSSLENS